MTIRATRTNAPAARALVSPRSARAEEPWPARCEIRSNRLVCEMERRQREAAAPAVRVQAKKLAVEAADDHHEKEADHLAAEALQAPGVGRSLGARVTPLTHRAPGPETVDAGAFEEARSGGAPLPDRVRSPMERSFGTSFADVRVHQDARADQLNRALGARALTAGSDIFFRHGELDPASRQGQRVIAHELTHVMQQRGPGSAGAPAIQALRVRAWNNMDEQLTGARVVEQSTSKRLDVHIGTGWAFTTGMHTCATLAMCDPVTGISYLLHADATVKPITIAQSLLEYQAVIEKNHGNPARVYARIYTQPGDAADEGSACKMIEKAFGVAGKGLKIPPAKVTAQKKHDIYQVSWHSVIVVGEEGGPAVYTGRSFRLDYALARYARTRNPLQLEFARQAIVSLCKDNNGRDQQVENESTYHSAAVRAYREGHSSVLQALYQHTGIDYASRAKEAVEEEARPKPQVSEVPGSPTVASRMSFSMSWADMAEQEDEYEE